MAMRFCGAAILALLAPALAGCDAESTSPTETVQLAVIADAENGGTPLSTAMTQETTLGPGEPSFGDEDGIGLARITLNHGQGEVCWELSASNIRLPAIASHIHRGADPLLRGPIVVPLTAPNLDGKAAGCATGVDRALIRDILQNPADYYVNVHTSEHIFGAIRGQLEH